MKQIKKKELIYVQYCTYNLRMECDRMLTVVCIINHEKNSFVKKINIKQNARIFQAHNLKRIIFIDNREMIHMFF